MKKILSALAALALTVTLSAPAASAPARGAPRSGLCA